MTNQYFSKELRRIQHCFNCTYGRQVTTDIQMRCSVILAICRLGMLVRKIVNLKREQQNQTEISDFKRIRDFLDSHFAKFNICLKNRSRCTCQKTDVRKEAIAVG